tara:strand:- start:7697 stop:9826 length:2130 start_codon:yes stop_codon:yes gene_type:complete
METRPEVGFWGNLNRQVLGQGLLMHHGDELTARLRAWREGIPLEQALAEEYMKVKIGEDKYPTSSILGQIGGALIPAVGGVLAAPVTGGGSGLAAAAGAKGITQGALNLLKSPTLKARMARGAGIGAGTGYISHRGLQNELDDAEQESWYGITASTGLGGLAGGTIPVVGKGVKAGYNWLKNRLAREGKSLDNISLEKIYNVITDRGGSPEDVYEYLLGKSGKKLEDINPLSNVGLDLPTSISAAGASNRGVFDLTNKLMSGDIDASDIVENALIVEKAGRRPRIENTLGRFFKSNKYENSVDEAMDTLRNNADVLYKEAYEAAPEITDPAILNLLKTNNSAFKQAIKDGQKIADIKYTREKFKYDKARADWTEASGRPPPIAPIKPPEISLSAKPSLEMLDYVKRGLDARVDRLYKTKGGSKKAEATELKRLADAFVERLDEVGGDAWKKARLQYKGDIQIRNALTDGAEKFDALSKKDILKKFAEYTPTEKEAFVMGVGNRLLAKVEKSPNLNKDFAGDIINRKDIKDKLQIMFPTQGPAAWNLLEAALQRESMLARKTNLILSKSPETPKLPLTAEEMSNPTSPTNIIQVLMRTFVNASMTKKSQKRMAEMLMENDPKKVAATLDAIQEMGKTLSRKAQQANVRQTGVAVTAAIATPSVRQDPSEGEPVNVKDLEKQDKTEDPYAHLRGLGLKDAQGNPIDFDKEK